MLAYLTQSGGLPVVPESLCEWLPRPGYALCHSDLADGLHMVGVGDPIVFSAPRLWHDLADGWRVGLTPGAPFNPGALTRGQLWCDTVTVCDLKDRPWQVPRIRDSEGRRAFRVAYGRDWLPALTPEQARCEEIADAATHALAAGDTPMSVGCQWAAELLAAANHISVEALAVLNLIDDRLVLGTISSALSRDVEKGAGNGL